MSDLVKRLRIQAAYDRRAFQSIKDALCWQAADRIAELKAQIEAAKSCQRYDQGEHRGYALGNALMEKCGDGDYVLFDDLEAALQQGNDDG